MPSLSRGKFRDPMLQQGKEATALLEVLAAFERPTKVEAALAHLKSRANREVIAYLVAGRFLQPVS